MTLKIKKSDWKLNSEKASQKKWRSSRRAPYLKSVSPFYIIIVVAFSIHQADDIRIANYTIIANTQDWGALVAAATIQDFIQQLLSQLLFIHTHIAVGQDITGYVFRRLCHILWSLTVASRSPYHTATRQKLIFVDHRRTTDGIADEFEIGIL